MFKSLIEKLRFRDTYREQPIVLEAADKQCWDITVDVAVAGFGGAGAAAALEAHDNGADTLLLDRFSGGGATNISGGIYYAGGGTSIQKEAGVEDDAQNMYNYLQHEVQGAVSDATLKDFCDSSVDNFDWMVKNGVEFNASYCEFKTSYPPDHLFFYYSGNESFAPYTDTAKPAPRGHRGFKKGMSGAAIFQPLKASVLNKGIQVKTETKVVALITDNAGEVIGLKAIHLNNRPIISRLHKALYSFQTLLRYMALYWPPLFNIFSALTEKLETSFGESIYIRAKKGVIMATGGFYLNQNLIKKHAPEFLGGSPLGTITDDGSGIEMATDLGAQTDLMDSVSAWRFINPPTSFVKGMMVGPSGKRVCNEMMYGAQVGSHMMHEHDGKAYVILDEKNYKQAYKDLRFDRALWFHILLGGFFLLLGCKKSPSIAGLANKLGINSLALQETLDEYNRIAASNELDPKGKPKDYMPVLADGPFYAIDISYDYYYVPCTTLTVGGLKINEDSNMALDQAGEDIKGLYAVGRSAVGIPSRGYVSGLSIADCIYAGRKAGKHAATQPS